MNNINDPFKRSEIIQLLFLGESVGICVERKICGVLPAKKNLVKDVSWMLQEFYDDSTVSACKMKIFP